MEGLIKKINKDGKAEEDLFESYVCWYKTVVSSKKASNAQAKDRIESLSAFIDDVKSGRVEFTSERKDLEAEVEKLSTEIETANSMRTKENEDFEAAKAEMEQAIAALELAVDVLGSMASSKEGVLASLGSDVRRAVQLGKQALSKGDAEFLEQALNGDVPEVDWKKLNRKATFKMKYKARSVKIQKILADMLQTFQDNLADATKKEKEAKAAYDKLMASKKDELDTAETALTDMTKEGSMRGMKKEEAQQEVDDLKAQIEADEGYIKDTEEAYKLKMEEWKERKKLRKLEVASINKAISILHSDDARDTFKKSFKSQGYLLLQKSAVSNLRQQASAAIRRAGLSAQDPRLAVLAMQLSLQQGGHFDKVIEA